MQLVVVILADEGRDSLASTLENLKNSDLRCRVLALRPVDGALEALYSEVEWLTGEWTGSLAEAWQQGLQGLAAEQPVLLLEAGETLAAGDLQRLNQAPMPGLVKLSRGELLEHTPRLLRAGQSVAGQVYPVLVDAEPMLSDIELQLPGGATGGLWLHQPEARRAWLEELESAGDASPDTLLALSLLRFQNRQDQRALMGFELLALRVQPDPWTLLGRVMELKTRWELNQRELVLEKIDAYRGQMPEIEAIPGIWVLRGVIARGLKESELALDCFQQARELSHRPDFARINRVMLQPDMSWKPLLGQAEIELGESLFSQAYLHFKQVLAELPDNDYVKTQLLKAAFFIRRHDTLQDLLNSGAALRGIAPVARELLMQMLNLAPAGPEALIDRVEGDLDALTSDPFQVSVLLEYAISLLHQRQFAQARRILRLLARMLANQPLIWHNLAYSHFAEGAYAEAEQYYRQALSIDSRFHDSRFDLAKVLVMTSRTGQALEELYELRRLQPHDLRIQQAIRQLEPAELDVYVPPLAPSSSPPETAPFVFVFPQEPSWENGADIALKAYLQEFVGEDMVIMAFPGSEDSSLLIEARAWAEARFDPELLPPVALLAQPMPLLPARSAWVLPWRIKPAAGLSEALQTSGYPALVTDMRITPAGGPLPSAAMAETTDDAAESRRLWREVDTDALANQMRLAVYGDFAPSSPPQPLTTHSFSAASAAAQPDRLAAQGAPESPEAAPPRISACLIVRDEEAVLDACLASLHDQVSEIIVVDTGSKDRTREIAAGYSKVRLFDFAWVDDFAAARNFALEQAREPWILSIDADETIGPDFVAGLAPWLGAPQQPDAYAFSVLALNADGSVDQAHSLLCVPRLFANRPEFRYRGRIHEMVYHQGHPRMRYFFLKGQPIYHTGYRPEVLAAKHKRLRDTALIERMIAEQPDAPETDRLYAILAGFYEADGEAEKALACLEQGLERVTEDPLIHGVLARGKLRLLNALGRQEEVLAATSQPLQRDSYSALYRAQALQQLGRPEEALLAAKVALHLADAQALQPDPLEQSLSREALLRDLASLCEATGDLAQAVYYYKRYLKLAPSPEHQRNLEKLLSRL